MTGILTAIAGVALGFIAMVAGRMALAKALRVPGVRSAMKIAAVGLIAVVVWLWTGWPFTLLGGLP